MYFPLIKNTTHKSLIRRGAGQGWVLDFDTLILTVLKYDHNTVSEKVKKAFIKHLVTLVVLFN